MKILDISSTSFKPVNISVNLENVFLAALNLAFAAITLEHINLIAGVFSLAFLVLRNIRFVLVLAFEIWLFFTNKRDRKRIVESWKREMNKRRKQNTEGGNDESKS